MRPAGQTSRRPERRFRRAAAFTLVEIMIVATLLVLLTTIAVPSYVRTRRRAQLQACIENLRQIEGAKDRYAIENGKTDGEPVTQVDIIPYFMKKWQDCPASGTYTLNPIGTPPTCTVSDHQLY